MMKPSSSLSFEGKTKAVREASSSNMYRNVVRKNVAVTVPLETMGPFARGKTSSLPNVVAANSPR